jgi:DGQHR domain-containing protein
MRHMGTLKVRCLKTVVTSGDRRYPLFVGFLSAEQVAAVAEAPSFSKTTSHRDIAANVLEPPVKGWQRPLDKERVAHIRQAFQDDGALMPNPVLLSENGERQTGAVKLRQEQASGTIPSNVWIVEIAQPADGSRPLWVLDGQHRINGLAASKQKENEIPVVLLLNDDDGAGSSYTGRDFAHLFAQVTTTAKKLDELHNEWLTFAYGLDEYADSNPDYKDHRAAMETVAELCRIPELANGQPNPFLNNVRFNPEVAATKSQPAFVYGCRQLKEILRKHYFASAAKPLSPVELATQLGLASRALKSVVRAPQAESVFFGKAEFAQLPMQDAFVIGVLMALQHQPEIPDWPRFLKKLNFHQTDWRFKSWVKTTGGKAGTDSRKVAERVLGRVFREGELPEGVDNLADYLRGNRAQVQISFSRLNENGKPVKPGRHTLNLLRGDDSSHEAEGLLHVKVAKGWKNANIARVEIVDATSNVANPKKLPAMLGAGYVLPEEAEERELRLAVYMVFYGGLGADAKLTIRW